MNTPSFYNSYQKSRVNFSALSKIAGVKFYFCSEAEIKVVSKLVVHRPREQAAHDIELVQEH